MKFNEKLQELRKQKGLTQEELAQLLHVSRAAVSKWESGRGYPNIDSLKEISSLFGISVDALLSADQLLSIAQEDHQQKENHFRDIIFGLIDIAAAMCFILPCFAQKIDETVFSVPLISLTSVSSYLLITYYCVLGALMLFGIVTLCLQNCKCSVWTSVKTKLSIFLGLVGIFVFVVSRQPYAASYLLIFMFIKVFALLKWQ